MGFSLADADIKKSGQTYDADFLGGPICVADFLYFLYFSLKSSNKK